MPADEITSVSSTFFYDRLAGYAPIQAAGSKGYHDLEIPQADTATERAALYPCVLIGPPVWEQNGKGNGNVIIWAIGNVEVVAIGLSTDFRKLEAIAKHFYPRLHGFFGDTSNGGYINSSDWIRPVRLPQTTEDVTFLRIGGLYRVKARLSST